jgi:NAD(P)-dependent dehydrogenase (short-subunit alcohol dehydrogenase family)
MRYLHRSDDCPRRLGEVYARELVARGAAKVYGAARNPAAVTERGVTPVALDITDPHRVAQVAARCADVSLLVNNAGVLKYSTFTGAPSLDAARAEMETNRELGSGGPGGRPRQCLALPYCTSDPTEAQLQVESATRR